MMPQHVHRTGVAATCMHAVSAGPVLTGCYITVTISQYASALESNFIERHLTGIVLVWYIYH